MKRILSGKTYNTDTSSIIAKDEYDQEHQFYGEIRHRNCLYQTRSGAFFLVEIESYDAKDRYEQWEERTKIQFFEMTLKDAQKWILQDGVEVIDSGSLNEPPEDGGETQDNLGTPIFIRVPRSLKTRIEVASAQSGVSVNAWALRCMERCLQSSVV